MRYKHSLAFFLILLCLPSYGHAQLWSGILASNRATDWTQAGVQGGIPSATWTQCGSTISAYTGTAATINNAIAACGTNQYVQLGAGTFTLSTAIVIQRSNVVLRGMGADQTFVVASGYSGCGVGGYTGAIQVCSGYPTLHTANWTGGYSQGATSITLDSVSGLSTGMFIILDQADDSSDGWPVTGDIYVCPIVSAGCSSSGGGGYSSRTGRPETEFHEVTAINGNTVTVTPPIINPNWRSGQSPGAYWGSPTTVNAGVENLSLDWTGVHNANVSLTAGIIMIWNRDCWVKGLRIVDTSTTTTESVQSIAIVRSFRTTVQDSYFYGPSSTPTNVASVLTQNVGQILVQNNIVQNSSQPVVLDGPISASVVAYSYEPTSTTTPNHFGFTHGAGEFENLWEGNIGRGWDADSVHGSHFMQTNFRNYWVNANSSAFNPAVQYIAPQSRFMNAVGNILGGFFSTYESSQAYSNTSVYLLGFDSNLNSDSNVKRTLLRWGNWDIVTNAVRWCGNSSDTGWSTTCGSTSEVPSGIANFSNPVPSKGDTTIGQPAMPPSFYLSSRPSWWPLAKPWPAIGPDVTGGNITNTAGHAYTNAAADCYLNVMNGPVDGSGGPLSFNAGKCYPPAPPTEVEAVAD